MKTKCQKKKNKGRGNSGDLLGVYMFNTPAVYRNSFGAQ